MLHWNLNINFWIDHYTATVVTLVATVVDPNGTFLRRISTEVCTSHSCSLLDCVQFIKSQGQLGLFFPSGNKTTLETHHPDSIQDMEAQEAWNRPCLWNCAGRWPLTPWKVTTCYVHIYESTSERRWPHHFIWCMWLGVPWKNLKRKHSTSIFFQLRKNRSRRTTKPSIKNPTCMTPASSHLQSCRSSPDAWIAGKQGNPLHFWMAFQQIQGTWCWWSTLTTNCPDQGYGAGPPHHGRVPL